VGGYDVTRADYESSLALINSPARPLPDDAPDVYRAFQTVHEEYTPEERALARCVRFAAQHKEAERRGIAVGLEEAAAYIEEMRRRTTDSEAQRLFALMEENFGAQEYWTEIAPAVYSRALSMMALKRHLKAETPSLRVRESWLSYEYGLALEAAASLTILDARLAAGVKEQVQGTSRIWAQPPGLRSRDRFLGNSSGQPAEVGSHPVVT